MVVINLPNAVIFIRQTFPIFGPPHLWIFTQQIFLWVYKKWKFLLGALRYCKYGILNSLCLFPQHELGSWVRRFPIALKRDKIRSKHLSKCQVCLSSFSFSPLLKSGKWSSISTHPCLCTAQNCITTKFTLSRNRVGKWVWKWTWWECWLWLLIA